MQYLDSISKIKESKRRNFTQTRVKVQLEISICLPFKDKTFLCKISVITLWAGAQLINKTTPSPL